MTTSYGVLNLLVLSLGDVSKLFYMKLMPDHPDSHTSPAWVIKAAWLWLPEICLICKPGKFGNAMRVGSWQHLMLGPCPRIPCSPLPHA